MTRVFFGDEIGFDQNANIGGVELFVDHGTVADEPAEPKISFDQWRQCGERPCRVNRVNGEAVHLDITFRQGPRPQGGR